ncbi:hypothetical protein [Sinirhodobacter huangdaonensis]|uniref:Uncharacterized protein n=1 Tax=Paenirhodobacter huangdaonensis TaxID=2501515 RepID=A0A3S3MAG7_9RHOB|nr:hypothetical protein [Sinirhodobacter huangdaonensis]RWR53326.1 hypothetical protein EOW66_06340 [Sinirhodobacter huangdaonensis]
MLQLPPHLINRKERRARDARRGRMGEQRYNALVVELARVIRLAFQAGATGSLWGLEGPLRAGIRSDLCLQGWGWSAADLMAREVLEDAFRKAGAMIRPTWNEGQPEWTIEAGTLIERTRCARCGKELPETRHKFCSDLCASAMHMRVRRIKEANEETALDMAVRNL